MCESCPQRIISCSRVSHLRLSQILLFPRVGVEACLFVYVYVTDGILALSKHSNIRFLHIVLQLRRNGIADRNFFKKTNLT